MQQNKNLMDHTETFDSLLHDRRSQQKMPVVALACPHDSHTEYVIGRALHEGLCRFILTACSPLSKSLQRTADAHPGSLETLMCHDAQEAAQTAVELVRNHNAQVLMKGMVNTDVLLRAVLDKQQGLLSPGSVMAHLTVMQVPGRKRLLMFADAAVLPEPTLPQLDALVRYMTDHLRRFGREVPRIALTNCNEKVNPKFPHTLHYEQIKQWAAEGRYGKVVIDGPMDVKTALDADAAAYKHITSPIEGKADALVFPNIQAGNTFYKTLSCFCHAIPAGWLAGTEAPVVVTSRADSEESKYYSLALACL